MRARRRPIRWSSLNVTLWCLLLGACASATQRARDFASQHALTDSLIQGEAFEHQVFWSSHPDGKVLYVFIDGDGVPWSGHGTRVASDPTPLHPLALALAARTAHPVLYLGRPCYFSVHDRAGCTPGVWTSGRYSAQVVDSMAVAANGFAAAGDYQHLVLIGYSGGGALAVLMAPKVPSTRAIITIAANLDVGEWARVHGYLPLDQSLDPATQPALPSAIAQRHLFGGRDLTVPERSTVRYFQRLQASQLWRFPGFDHVCCWIRHWPDILKHLDEEMALNAP
ncbi:MAG TPA: hypothetical protein VNZ06_09890 [Steroidobacteraceae bacterium]|nr:hypothetical protein [Steroidobacteraceae bacterium]